MPALLPLHVALVGPVSYLWPLRTVRQLPGIRRPHRDYTDVRLTRVRPLYALSRVTALSAIGFAINIDGWYLAQPGQDPDNPVFVTEGGLRD